MRRRSLWSPLPESGPSRPDASEALRRRRASFLSHLLGGMCLRSCSAHMLRLVLPVQPGAQPQDCIQARPPAEGFQLLKPAHVRGPASGECVHRVMQDVTLCLAVHAARQPERLAAPGPTLLPQRHRAIPDLSQHGESTQRLLPVQLCCWLATPLTWRNVVMQCHPAAMRRKRTPDGSLHSLSFLRSASSGTGRRPGSESRASCQAGGCS